MGLRVDRRQARHGTGGTGGPGADGGRRARGGTAGTGRADGRDWAHDGRTGGTAAVGVPTRPVLERNNHPSRDANYRQPR